MENISGKIAEGVTVWKTAWMWKELGSIDASICRMNKPQGFEIVLEPMANDDCDRRTRVGSATCYSKAQLRLCQLTCVVAYVAAEHSIPELMDV